MATYFQELRDRKKSLNQVKNALTSLDSQGERFERKLRVMLRRKKFMFDHEDGRKVFTEISELRRLFKTMESKAEDFAARVT